MPKKLRFKHDGTRLEKERKKGRKKGEGKRDGGALRVSDHVLPTIQLTRDTLGLLESLGETLSRAKPPTDIPFASPPLNHPSPHTKPIRNASFPLRIHRVRILRIFVLRFRVDDASISSFRLIDRAGQRAMHTQQVPTTPLSLSSLSSLRDHAVEHGGHKEERKVVYRGGRDLDPSSYGEKGYGNRSISRNATRKPTFVLGWIRLCEKRRGSRDLHATGRGRRRERERESFQSSINDAYVVISMQGELG